jgi:NTP pyrophosphatase (non-canonical NTP hydrolase)
MSEDFFKALRGDLMQFVDAKVGCGPEHLRMGTHACLDLYINVLDLYDILGGDYAVAAARIRNERRMKKTYPEIAVENKTQTLNDATANMLTRIAIELGKARAKFPSSYCSMVALTEEVGELAKACLDESPERIMDEAVQVAAMAIRVAIEGDGSIAKYRQDHGQTIIEWRADNV